MTTHTTHQQHHSVTHSTQKYAVTTHIDDHDLRKMQQGRNKKHRFLLPLLLIFLFFVASLLALEYMTGWIRSQFKETSQSHQLVRPNLSQQLEVVSPGLLFRSSNGFVFFSLTSHQFDNATPLNSVLNFTPESQIRSHPSRPIWLSFSKLKNGNIRLIGEQGELDINTLALKQYEAIQFIDALWHPSEPIVYILFSAERYNLIETHLLQLNFESNQSRVTLVSVGTDPILAWVHPRDSRVFIQSQLPQQQTQLTTVTASGSSSQLKMPVQMLGKANEVGLIPVLSESNIHLTSIFAAATNNPILEMTAPPELVQASWDDETGRIALLYKVDSEVKSTVFNTAGTQICSETMPSLPLPLTQVEHKGWVHLTNSQASLISAQDCSIQVLQTATQPPPLSYHGRL